MSKIKNNNFTRCKNKIEVVTKSTFKSPEVDVLFCILDDSVYVYQGFKLINVTLEHFANGMDISLIEAQAIVSGGVDTIEDAKAIVRKSIDTFDAEDKAKALGEAVFGEIDEKIDTLKTNTKEKVEDYTKSMVGDFIDKTKEKVEEKAVDVIEEGKSLSEEKKLDAFEQIKNLVSRISKLEQRVRTLEGNKEVMSEETEVEENVSEVSQG